MTRILIQLISRLTLLCGCIVALTLVVGRSLPPEPELLFTASFGLGDLNIYRMSLQRQMTLAVTHDPNNDFLPDWSPDGQQIAFVSDRDGYYNIYITDAQGSVTRRLVNEDRNNQHNPVWSPDGKYIAYVNEEKGYRQIMLYNAATGSTESMTDSYRTNVNPVWSIDGQNITFVSDLDERWNTKIYSLNIETRIISPILVGSATNPVWSPDGRYLLYTSGIEKPNLFLWDSSLNQVDLLYDGNFIDNDTPAWSADGRSITISAFTIGGESGLFQLPVDECLSRSAQCIPHELTVIPAFYRNPHWKPTQSLSSQ